MYDQKLPRQNELCFAGTVWQDPDARIFRGWKAELRTAGITDFRFYDLCHSCASYLAMSTANPAAIAIVLGGIKRCR